jgi:hypothetical protein
MMAPRHLDETTVPTEEIASTMNLDGAETVPGHRYATTTGKGKMSTDALSERGLAVAPAAVRLTAKNGGEGLRPPRARPAPQTVTMIETEAEARRSVQREAEVGAEVGVGVATVTDLKTRTRIGRGARRRNGRSASEKKRR